MNFRDVVKLSDLIDGDVFYLNGDSKKIKMVLVSISSKRSTSKLGYTYTAIFREQAIHVKMKNPNEHSLKHDKEKKEAENVEVVFLRHKEAIA